MKFKLHKEYTGNLLLSEGFVREHAKKMDALELCVYLYLVAYGQNKTETELPFLAKELDLEFDGLVAVLGRLEARGLIKVTSSSVSVLPAAQGASLRVVGQKQYTPEEIAGFADEDVKALVRVGERCFGKLLSNAEVNSLMGLYNWLGMPVEVLTVLIEYVTSLGKKSMGYIEKVAIEWSDKEIDTVEKAHRYVGELEQKKNQFEQVKNLLGIYGRSLTKKEQELAAQWKEKYTDQQILTAYEKTVDATGKISFPYTDKILKSMDENGNFPEKPQAQAAKKPDAPKVKPSKFHNFSQKPTDFDDIEKAALEKLLKKAGRGNG